MRAFLGYYFMGCVSVVLRFFLAYCRFGGRRCAVLHSFLGLCQSFLSKCQHCYLQMVISENNKQ